MIDRRLVCRRWLAAGMLATGAAVVPGVFGAPAGAADSVVPSTVATSAANPAGSTAAGTPSTVAGSAGSPSTTSNGIANLALTKSGALELALNRVVTDGTAIVGTHNGSQGVPELVKVDATGKVLGRAALPSGFVEELMMIDGAAYMFMNTYAESSRCEVSKVDLAALKPGAPKPFIEGDFGCGQLVADQTKPRSIWVVATQRKQGDTDELVGAKVVGIDVTTGKVTSYDALSAFTDGYRASDMVVINGTAFVVLVPPFERATTDGTVPASTAPQARKADRLARIGADGKPLVVDLPEDSYIAAADGKLYNFGREQGEIDQTTLKLSPVADQLPRPAVSGFVDNGKAYRGYASEGKLKISVIDVAARQRLAAGEVDTELSKDDFGSVNFVKLDDGVYAVVASSRYDSATQKTVEKSLIYKVG